ncbi:MAG: GPW/gp25 family protein [Acidobacteriaceae bacterium]|nr:GPW/gp25 family protein [Acidobacteriaceae bacterium]MBV9778552.1 GPW/gp25 family protein [Acidobacteriaceae bacterium]
MNVDFLGRGWNFPVSLKPGEGICMSADDQSVEQAIWIILATAPGERMLRPDFGCGIHDLVFSVNDARTREQVTQRVERALILWEPRIDVLSVNTETKGRGEVLLINIQYRVRTTNNVFNMVFPFYLDWSATA